MPCDPGPAPLQKDGCLSPPVTLTRVYSRAGEQRLLVSWYLLGFLFLCAFCCSVVAELCRPFPEGWIPEEAKPSWRRQTDRDRQTGMAAILAFRRNAAGPGREGASLGLTSASGIKLLPVFAFRMNTFLSWPGSLSIFETSVSKTSHLWVVVVAVRARPVAAPVPEAGCLWTAPAFWEVLHGFAFDSMFPILPEPQPETC